MARTIRLQSDSYAHDRPWRVAVEQWFFAEEGLDVVYQEDNPKGNEGRVKDFSQRWKETQLQQGTLEVYPVYRASAAVGPRQDHRTRRHHTHRRDHGEEGFACGDPCRSAQHADRGHVACGHILCRRRSHGGGWDILRRDQTRTRG